ncbi:mobilization protein, partial [Escherichia coli]
MLILDCSSRTQALHTLSAGFGCSPEKLKKVRKRLVRTVLIFTESSDQLSRATDRVPGLPASPG